VFFLVTDFLGKMITKIFGSANERMLKSMAPIVEAVCELEPKMNSLSDEELRNLTPYFKERLEKGETLDDLLPEAFAACRESARRNVRTHDGMPMRHFDVQIVGGIVLHRGSIAEMQTGEGKTLVATLAAYLNALGGKGVHVVTVNDYLARRDAEWMGPVYQALGLTVGFIQSHMPYDERKVAYSCDITYGTNNEFGFDYLRDNMKMSIEEQVQGHLGFAIVDEVDSILIDEARTPLIISGSAEKATDLYHQADKVVKRLRKDSDYEVKEKEHTVTLTDEGQEKAEQFAGLPGLYNIEEDDIKAHELRHCIDQALIAHNLYHLDQQYIIKDGEVVIVDEFTGRLMPGRVWSDGLHQAVAAKENVKIREETQTLATVTLQNYFRMYDKLAGMTGTALTEAVEFMKIYKLGVTTIPTNRPLLRTNYPDVIFRTRDEKWKAVVEEIWHRNQEGRPVLVGTRSVEDSERLSRMLKKRGIVKHEILNAKHHEREALIVTNAGQEGAVTIATNMAGRGTDIVLGECVAELGGLHIIGTERHEARRIDNQLRGRSGRQGDPGSSVFIVSLEDDLMRIFAGERVRKILGFIGMKEGVSISHGMVSRAVERAQKKVEERNFEIRKNLLDYDEVMDKQRKGVYSSRQKILRGESLKEDFVIPWLEDSVAATVDQHIGDHLDKEERDVEALKRKLEDKYGLKAPASALSADLEEVTERLTKAVKDAYEAREGTIGAETMRKIECWVMLQKLDEKWKDHLYFMDILRSNIGLEAYAQKDPKVQYIIKGSQAFEDMLASWREEVVELVPRVKLREEETPDTVWNVTDYSGTSWSSEQAMREAAMEAASSEENIEPIKAERKVGRNDPCPCGSGKKYKKCCGRTQ
jgi:preprotein translocase subunit SecA